MPDGAKERVVCLENGENGEKQATIFYLVDFDDVKASAREFFKPHGGNSESAFETLDLGPLSENAEKQATISHLVDFNDAKASAREFVTGLANKEDE